jgi:hypothetical protein
MPTPRALVAQRLAPRAEGAGRCAATRPLPPAALRRFSPGRRTDQLVANGHQPNRRRALGDS